ncbi:HU-CCDC81 and SPOR domain-containing protein [Streptomyces albus]|uniref:pPIWI_RE_Y domain-containing protein n=1 Tax=Streptomyces albus TaxID=1888 RepID=UPI0006E3211B|nr:HU-CCDC81 and SPOR domain-containing protein [Streptomyces albus]
MTATTDTGMPTDDTDWSAHRGVPLMRTLATALTVLDAATGPEAYSLPYPPEVQRALDRAVLACLERGAEPPVSLPDLLSWCRERPVADWPVGLPTEAAGPDDLLLDPESSRPTELCYEWAEQFSDSALVLYDREIIRAALRLCREYGEEDAYTEFRRLLVTRPVLTSAEEWAVSMDHVLDPVKELLSRIYRPVPDSYLRGDVYATCGRCLTLLTPLPDGGWWCERDRCRRRGRPPVGRRIAQEEAGELLQLARPLRQFVTGPGRAEVQLEGRLTALGLKVRMWPAYDAYDVHVTFPDGWVWAVDVKDWAHPAFLGRAARPVPQEPQYDEAFWVVPQDRVDDRPGYIATYERNRPAAARRVPLLTDTHLLVRAEDRLARFGGATRKEETGDA